MSERKTHDEKCEATGSNYIVYCRCPERRLERERDAAVEELRNVVAQAESNPFLAVGMLVEHHSNIRATLRARNEPAASPAAPIGEQ